MATTLTIPLSTLTVGAHSFGPASVADTDTNVVLDIDRTVTNHNVQGFNGQPATTQATIEIDQSNDGGATWQVLAVNTFAGGTVTSSKTGQVITDSTLTTEFNPGTGRQARALVTVSGASVAVAGTLTTS